MRRLLCFLLPLVCCIALEFADNELIDDPGCPNGYSSNDTNICHKIYTTALSKDDAMKQCISDGGALSKVSDEDANSYIHSLISEKNIKLLWLGIDCEGNTTDCTYEEEGTVNYTNFYEENPAPIGSCVYMSGKSTTPGKWFLFDCSQAFPYVCETEYGKQCPTGYKKYRSSCYRFVEEPATHIDAELTCRKDCGTLASVQSELEAVFITSQATNITGQYKSISIDNSTTTYLKNGYHDTHVGDCLGLAIADGVVKQGEYSSVNCETALPFMCKTGFKSANQCPDANVSFYTPLDVNSNQKMKGTGTVYSPGWPMSLYNSLPSEYIYYIVTPPGTVVEVNFPVLELSSTTIIKLYNDISAATTFAEITAESVPQYGYKSTLNQMVVIVSSNKSDFPGKQDSRWQMTYKPTDNIGSCLTSHKLFERMCYRTVELTTSVSLSEAEEECRKNPGGILVSITSEKTNEFLKRLANMDGKGNDIFMIGLACAPYEECSWSSGESTNYTNFVDEDTRMWELHDEDAYVITRYCTVWQNGKWRRQYTDGCREEKLFCQSTPVQT